MKRMTLDQLRQIFLELADDCQKADNLRIHNRNLDMPPNLAWDGLKSERKWYFSGYRGGLLQALFMLRGWHQREVPKYRFHGLKRQL